MVVSNIMEIEVDDEMLEILREINEMQNSAKVQPVDTSKLNVVGQLTLASLLNQAKNQGFSIIKETIILDSKDYYPYCEILFDNNLAGDDNIQITLLVNLLTQQVWEV